MTSLSWLMVPEPVSLPHNECRWIMALAGSPWPLMSLLLLFLCNVHLKYG